MTLPTLDYDENYPTLHLKVQQPGYGYDNSSDFITTDLRGGPARINPDVLNGWYIGKLKILIKDMQDAQYWHDFYTAAFNGKTGGIERVMPFFFYGIVDDVKGYHLCQIVKSSYKHSNFRWNVRDIQLEIQIQPPQEDSRPCFNSGDMINLYNCGYKKGEDEKLSQTAGDGFDPLNNW